MNWISNALLAKGHNPQITKTWMRAALPVPESREYLVKEGGELTDALRLITTSSAF